MMIWWDKLVRKFSLARYLCANSASIAVEAAFIFPIMMTVLLGTIDVGHGMLAAQKNISAAQMIADLVARDDSVGGSGEYDLDDIIAGAKRALSPYIDDNPSGFSVHIVSMKFVDDGSGNGEAEVCWEHSYNNLYNDEILTSAQEALDPEIGEGLVGVTVRFEFEPPFSSNTVLIDDITLEQVIFVRGRTTAVVRYDGSCPGGSV